MRHILCSLCLVGSLFAWWSTPQNLGISGADDIYPQACKRQTFDYPSCLVWQTNLNGNWDIFSRFSGIRSWGDTVRVTSSGAADQYPSVAYDYSRNCYWCVWQHRNVNNWDIYVARGDTLNGWLTPYQLTTDTRDDSLPSVYVNNDTVWVVWQRYPNIISAYYEGTTWSTPIRITNDSTFWNMHPEMHSRHNRPFVVWQRAAEILYSEFISGSWQTPQQVASVLGVCYPKVTNQHDSWGPNTRGVWVVWADSQDGNYEVYTTGCDTLDVHYRLTYNDSADITPAPLYYIALIAETGPVNTAFSTNRNGNYDIYTHFGSWSIRDTVIPIDTTSSEDILPVMAGGYEYVWTLWQSDRNTDWDIYGSYISVGGVEGGDKRNLVSSILSVTPNPFRQSTRIMLNTRNKTEDVKVKIYNSAGMLVKEIPLPGAYSLLPIVVSWDGSDNNGERLPNGVYLLKLTGQGQSETRKVLFVR